MDKKDKTSEEIDRLKGQVKELEELKDLADMIPLVSGFRDH